MNGSPRWCLWLGECPPERLRKMPECLKRVEAVKAFRLASKSDPTIKLAATPTRFHVENMPSEEYLLIPRHTSERRRYVPFGYLSPDVFAGDSCLIIGNASVYCFGVLSSAMHMAWLRQVCGRIKSDYRYSAKLVYNNFPWPEPPKEKHKAAVEAKAQSVLDARAAFPDATLADLYDPRTMPAKLAKAHASLDRAVDACYRSQRFDSDRQRVEFLFRLYEKLTSPLTVAAKKPRKKRGASD
jgi:hypothetical protein